jgi:cell division protein FtsQ
LKKINYRKISFYGGWIIAGAVTIACLSFVSAREKQTCISSVDIRILNSEENLFIQPEEVRDFLKEKNISLIAKTYKATNLHRLEKCLEEHPAVENAEACGDLSGNIQLALTQRTPVVRIINRDGESYYLDSRSRLMPLSPNFTARVLIASGEISEPYSRRHEFSALELGESKSLRDLTMLDEIYRLSRFIAGDPELSRLIHQVYVNSEGEFELLPAAGGHRIIFGKAENLEAKFSKLRFFYREGLCKAGAWGDYSSINLKFKNLVVCSKKQLYGK